jgi:hypothetical protein
MENRFFMTLFFLIFTGVVDGHAFERLSIRAVDR